MMKKALTFIALITACGLHGETVDQVINKARAQIGTEKALKAVETIQYGGEVLDAEGNVSGRITLDFKRPYLQRLELDTTATIETTGVNGFEGWRERIDKENPLKSGVMVLPPMQVQYLLANARENLNFFRGPDTAPGGKIELDGSAEQQGKDTWKVIFKYPGGMAYTRYFDKKTGALVATQSGDSDFIMVEKGTIEVAGIKFPKEVQTFNGDELVRSVVFSEVKINEPIDDTIFDFPAIPTRSPIVKP